jgi:hypothetical protein
MSRSRLAKEITCGVLCALTLAVAVPIGIVLILLFSAIDAIARRFGKEGRHGRR